MKKLALALALPVAGFALEQDPWFDQCYEFLFRADYSYDFFRKIDHASPPLHKTQQTHVVGAELELTAPETWNWQLELELATTNGESFGYRSFALQIMRGWLDDVCGDPISLATGFLYRDASSRFLHAPSTPYHARANFEFYTSMGKEWSRGHCWLFRVFALGAVGQGSRGSPWARGDLTLWANSCDRYEIKFYVKSYFGFGDHTTVDLDPFRGWAKIRHQSVDIGGSYRFCGTIYGSLRFDYLYRVYARSYPEHVNWFQVTYELPFCPF